ncbi:MAG: L-ribulose-5-phosphate 4-epimerase [Candidatus Anoxymicrobium japonicum]|uniref:L-ribulose-5-phosphate 4-epimerase n=1 Tax=Candidatus Anoxymicrobium japonicum TaxID=2013648 RepID=A0A2N3G709_9ACTN|nr:MAG: L-ribulose-5-phosphate 4-epimerase [Candidatus Anoxymicrobium japonicum]
MGSLIELKHAVYKCNMELQARGLVLYTFGNASGIDRGEGVVAIKPSGVPYDELSPDDMVLVDLDNNLVEGVLKPSSDTPTHTALYRAFPLIGGVAHTHSTCATAWAQAMRPIPCLGTTHADHLPASVPCTEPLAGEQVTGDYEAETGGRIVNAFDRLSYREVPMALVASHGPFTWGETPEEAVFNSVVLEELARLALLTLALDPATAELDRALVDRHFQRKHGEDASYGQ